MALLVLNGLRFVCYCGKIHSRHLFSYYAFVPRAALKAVTLSRQKCQTELLACVTLPERLTDYSY